MAVEGATNVTGQPVRQEYEPPVKQKVTETPVQVKKEIDVPVEEKTKEYPEYVPSVSEKVWREAVEAANKKLDGVMTEFRFSVHEKTNRISVKVLNKDTGELIREIPPEKVLDMVAKLWEMSGIFVDERR